MLSFYHGLILNQVSTKILISKFFYNEEYQYLQFKKIFDLNRSIIKYGYLPERFPTRQGGISGYFLTKGIKKFFYVVSGNHRVAVLSSLFPKKKIPVVFENIKNLKKGIYRILF